MEGEQKKPQSIRALRLPGGQKLIAYECTPPRALQTCTGLAEGANQKCCSVEGTRRMLRRGHRISLSACRRPVVNAILSPSTSIPIDRAMTFIGKRGLIIQHFNEAHFN